MTDTLDGSCLCGSVTVTARISEPDVHVCHCRMCQQWAGGPLLTLPGVTRDALTINGEEQVHLYRSSEWADRASCANCGSALWFAFNPANKISLLAGLFELPGHFAMADQIFVDEKPQFYDFAQETPCKTGAEIIAEAKAAGFDFG